MLIAWDVSRLASGVTGNSGSETITDSASVLSIRAHNTGLLGLQVSDTGQFLFTGGTDDTGSVKAWRLSAEGGNVLSTELVQTVDVRGHSIMRMEMDQTGAFLISCGYEGTVYVFTVNETPSGTCPIVIKHQAYSPWHK